VREAAEAERKRAEADLETFINTRSRLENELAEAEQQKIKMEKSLSERKHDGGAAASKDEKVFPTHEFSIWLYNVVHRNKLRQQLKGCRLCARR
jgi:NurA-like 5'-3' nuclease